MLDLPRGDVREHSLPCDSVLREGQRSSIGVTGASPDANAQTLVTGTRHAPPAIRGRRVRIRYMTQTKARPPTFALFGNQLDSLPEDYVRYLTNGLRKSFDLIGTPLRFLMRTQKNPYAKK